MRRTFAFEDTTGITKRQLNRLLDHDTMTNEQIERLRLRYLEDGDLRSRDELVQNFQRVVAKVARKFVRKNPRLELSELISEGNLGLLNAVEVFDPSKGSSFYSYAMRGAWNYIVEYLRKNNDTVVVTHTGRDKGHGTFAVSIDEIFLSEEGEESGEDRLAQLGVYSSPDVRDLPSLDETLMAYGDGLSEREREVIRLRAGEATFETIGKELGISIARSEQILQAAIKKVRSTVVETGVL